MSDWGLFLLVRVLLPLTLILASLVRPVGISLIYLFLFFLTPWLLQSTTKMQRTLLIVFLSFLCFWSGIFITGHIAITLTDLLLMDISSQVMLQFIFRILGFVSLLDLRMPDIIHLVLPDIFVFGIAIGSFIYSIISSKRRDKQVESEEEEITDKSTSEISTQLRLSEVNRLLILVYIRSFLKTSPIFSLIVLYFAATLRPSLPGSLYFIVFIVFGTHWALYRPLYHGMYYALTFMVIALTLNIISVVSYQLESVQTQVDHNNIWIRVMGMEVLLFFGAGENGIEFDWNQELDMDSYLSPAALMVAYFVTTLNLINRARFELTFDTIRMNLGNKSNDSSPDNDKTNTNHQHSEPPSLLEQFFYMVFDITSFIYKNSYILLNIMMMIWSIVYHSWLTFVLLIWANVLWMIPNHRRSMMGSSFFIVLYAEFLVITQYIYGMNFYESELPTKVKSCGVNLEQIGFVHPQYNGSQPWMPLAVKTGFLFVFWITSRQYFKERAEDKMQSDLLRLIFGPQHYRSERSLFEKSQAPHFIIFIFESISNLVARIWMWLLIFLIFLCAMVDRSMTGFRICYMSLFLLFLMVFQMSLQLWIKFLYGYWMFLIFYAMSILTVIYTYQFDNFEFYWENYLNVQPALQNDIGLRRYRTKDLFLHLLIPTLTVIFTVIQLHYFHQRFMDSVRRPVPLNRKGQGSLFAFNIGSQHNVFDSNRQSWKVYFYAGYRRLRSRSRRWFRPGKTIVWGFLQMHMIKAVIITSFYCAISEICFFNFFIAILSLMSVSVNRFLRRVVFRLVTFWVSVLVLMKMIYQIQYLDESQYDYLCKNVTGNFAEWMGLRKTHQVWGALMRYISPYIMYMIVTSLHAVVKLREHLIRYSSFDYKEHKVLFPSYTREDAEHDLGGLLKYMLNYGYYKFGLEITLIALVASITHRRDALSLTYIAWLIIILCLTRLQCARLWDIFHLYFVVSVLLQYLYLLSFPPSICINTQPKGYGVSYRNLWFELDESTKAFVKSKLMLDFIVLLCISRQRKAFKIELRHLNDPSFEGGDNKNVIHNIAQLGHVYFDNPTHDFCSYVRNYSDVLKTAIFCGFFWVTLAIVFMGGVCSMDLLSLGYLMFALIFLLQGSEVYLQNIHYILCRWNCLVAFNVFNIIVKVTLLALSGAIDANSQIFQSLLLIMYHSRGFNRNLDLTHTNRMEDAFETYHYGPEALIFGNTLAWHAIIFIFIIFQHRIFRSYYFCHVIMDTHANSILASRGAAIIENLHYKQIYDRREHEKNVLESVKAKMEIIRDTNKKIYKRMRNATSGFPHPTHIQYDSEVRVDDLENNSTFTKPMKSPQLTDAYYARPFHPKRRDLRLHPHAIRTGDYYMFDELDDADDVNVNEEYDFLEREDLRSRQMLMAQSKSRVTQNRRSRSSMSLELEEESSTDNDDFDTHPVIKLTSELILLITFRLNRISRNYRFVHRVLSAEKKTLQEISIMNRLGLSNTAAMFDFLNQSLNDKLVDGSRAGSNLNMLSKGDDFTTLDHNEFVQMLIAMWYAIIANTEVICYLMVFINQAANSSMSSLPLPLLVLCWGALTLPRPTKTFWVTLITYTLALIFFKCIMHQRIILEQKLIKRSNELTFELIMKHGNAIYDLLLLVVLFWHRYMLKKQGIWSVHRENSDILLLDSNTSKVKRTYSKEGPRDILDRLRQDAGADSYRSNVFDRDLDDVLRPGMENKYVYENIESKYYRRAMQRLANKGGFLSCFYKFFLALRHKARLSTDVYSLLFLCDFVSFFVLLFGFPKFAYRYKYSTSVLEAYIQGNKVPFSFLLMLIVQFVTIVTERAIYLRKALVYKIIFHFITVIGIHIWMFFLVPYVTAHSFGATAPVTFYLIKCLHMALSAYQIRCGYPKRILGNVFIKGYSLVNYIAFKIYMEIPFLYILRTLLDWVCIDTTLTVMEWIKMEDIFQSVFIVRCYRQLETDFPVLRGEPKPLYIKLLIGGTIILVLIALIWSPLFLFALVGTVGKPNVPYKAEIDVKIGQYEPIYISQTYSGIHRFTDKDYQSLLNSFSSDHYASDHILMYDAVDVSAIKFDPNSVVVWNMSPPDKNRLLEDLKTGKKVIIRVTLTLTGANSMDIIKHESTYTLTKNKELTREMLIKVLSNDYSKERILVPNILPKFITVEKQKVNVKFIRDYDGKYTRPMILEKKNIDGDMWWEMRDYCEDNFYYKILSSLPLSDCDFGIVIYVFYDKSFPTTLSYIEKTGIIGLYTTFVFLVSRIIRSLIANNHRRIMFEDLPYVDRILKLCNDIYLVRETQEYRLEEDLYAKLIFLYRSPETLIKWTRYKDDNADDPTGSIFSNRSRQQPSDDDANSPTRPPNQPPP